MTVFTSLDALVPFAKARALRGIYDGRATPQTMRLLNLCTHEWRIGLSLRVAVIFTRDAGHHSGGWWKNPDYERCYHLSLSYRDLMTDESMPQRHDKSGEIAKAFFGDDARLCWIEPPAGAEGRYRDVWHYRLFCDEDWQPILPRGEVYSREETPAGWKSFSELHGWSPKREDAPWLMAASESAS